MAWLTCKHQLKLKDKVQLLIKASVIAALLLPSFNAAAAPLMVPGLGTFSITKLTQAGVSKINTVRNSAGEVVYQFVDDSGNVLRSFIFGKSNPQVLNEFMPSKLSRYFSYLGQNSGKIAKHKIKDFPFEAFTFFVAIGAITTGELIFNYNQNPVAMDQFLTSQKDPVAQMGFAAFMVANGLTSEPLMAVAQTKGAKYFIPYLGMSVGMIASNIVHEIGHFPGLKECALGLGKRGLQQATALVGGSAVPDMKVCDKAFEAWTKMSLSEKGHEWAPGLFAMVASTALAGGIEAALTGSVGLAARMSSAVAIRMIAIEMLITVTPGGMVFRGARWTYKLAQLSGFIYLDVILRAPMVFTWKNSVQLGPQLRDADQRIGILAKRKLLNGWAAETALNAAGNPACAENQKEKCYLDLDRELIEFQAVSAKWREANLESVLMAHANWSQYLHQLTSQYRLSKQFYTDFASDLWKKKFETPENYTPLMDRALPLYGVTPKGLESEDQDKFLLQPSKVQEMQMQTVADVVAGLSENAAQVNGLRADQRKVYEDIVAGLASKDINKIGIALQDLRYRLWKDPMQHLAPTMTELKNVLEPIFAKLGDPKPLMAPGQGYLKLVAKDPSNPIYANSPFSGGNGIALTPTAPEYLVMQMIMGPDAQKGENTITNNLSGFPASFEAPRIRLDGQVRSQRLPQNPRLGVDLNQSIFGLKFWVERNGKVSGGGTMFDYLRNEGVRPEVLGDESEQRMAEWWEQYPEKQFTKAFISYEQEYEDIIQDLHQKLFRSESSVLNRGPISNGILKALEQERSVYLYILDAFLNSSEGRRSAAPADETKYSVLVAAGQLQNSQNDWTKAMMTQWKSLEVLLGKLQQKPVRTAQGTRNFVVSRVTNQELQNLNKSLEELVKQFPVEDMDQLSDFQKKVIAAALQGLSATSQEILNLGQIINNVSYVENFLGDAGGEPMPRRCLNAPAARGTQQWLATQYRDCP
ncbi:MAG: hypothetical protein ACK5P7_05835 [Bdellovibrio sp.]|jgi:hypothetical protein